MKAYCKTFETPDKGDALATGSPSRILKMTSKTRTSARRIGNKKTRAAVKNEIKKLTETA